MFGARCSDFGLGFETPAIEECQPEYGQENNQVDDANKERIKGECKHQISAKGHCKKGKPGEISGGGIGIARLTKIYRKEEWPQEQRANQHPPAFKSLRIIHYNPSCAGKK